MILKEILCLKADIKNNCIVEGVKMFNRKIEGYHDNKQISTDDLIRFNNDDYAAKYLIPCYNPEFKVRVTFLKTIPIIRNYSLEYRTFKYNYREEVL